MAPRARSTSLPEFLTNATLGELFTAEIEVLANPAPDVGEYGQPAATPVERARRSMLNRAVAEIREYHAPASDD